MQAYKPYVDYILAGKVGQTAYVLSHDGAVCATNLPIKALPSYNFDLVDAENPNVTHNVVVDERKNLLEALDGKGVCKDKAGIRLYNQKYYTVRYDQESKTLYLKKQGGGACIVKTNKLIIIGTFNSTLLMDNKVNQNPGELNKRVQTLAKDLISKGY